jgi:hypothetical protein
MKNEHFKFVYFLKDANFFKSECLTNNSLTCQTLIFSGFLGAYTISSLKLYRALSTDEPFLNQRLTVRILELPVCRHPQILQKSREQLKILAALGRYEVSDNSGDRFYEELEKVFNHILSTIQKFC